MLKLVNQVRTEFLLEYRSWAQSSAILLLVFVIVYVCSRIRPELDTIEFNFIFWLLLMMISINVAVRSNSHGGSEEHILLYTLIKPSIAFFSRFLFHLVYLGVVGIGLYGAFILFYSPQIEFDASFFALILLGAFGITSALSFVSAVVNHMPGQNTILSILSIPVLIPTVIILFNMGMSLFMRGGVEINQYLVLISISVLSIALSLVLFPVIWKQ